MSSRSLDDLDPRMKPLAERFLAACKSAGYDILVTCTLRSLDEQEKLYAIGRTAPGKRVTNAKPGTSAHNWGLAIDIVPLINGKPYWNFTATDRTWQAIGKLGKEAGLEWLGAPGSEFVEGCHFQYPKWRDFK